MAFATGMGRPMDLMAALTENDKLRSQVIDRNKKISELERLLFEIRVKGTMVCIHSDFDSPHREGFKAVGSGPDIFYWHKLLDPWADAFDMVRKLKSFLGSDLTPRMLINLMVTKRHTKPCNEDRTERNKCGDLNKWHMNLKLTTELLDRPMDDDDAGDCAEYLKQKIVFQTCAACNLEKLWFRDAPHDPFCQGINEFSVLAGELTRCGHTVCSACLLQSIRNSVDGLERCGALVDRGIPESFGCPAPGCQLYLDIPHLAALEQTLHRLGSQDVAALTDETSGIISRCNGPTATNAAIGWLDCFSLNNTDGSTALSLFAGIPIGAVGAAGTMWFVGDTTSRRRTSGCWEREYIGRQEDVDRSRQGTWSCVAFQQYSTLE